MKLYYVISPIGFVREACLANSEEEAVELVTKKSLRVGSSAWVDIPRKTSPKLKAYEIKLDEVKTPQIIRTGW